MINSFSNYKNYVFLRLVLVILNDLLILNLSLYFSYFLRLDYFIKIYDISHVFFISSFIYLVLFYIFDLARQYLRYFNLNSITLYAKLYFVYLLLFALFVIIQKSYYIPLVFT